MNAREKMSIEMWTKRDIQYKMLYKQGESFSSDS
jgi:hypothetical protein